MAPLERDRELAAIEGAAQTAALGNGSVVLIEGPAGIGKSAVLDEARRRTAGDMRSLFARGGLLERDFAFGVVRQLLEVAARDRDVPAAAHSILAEPASHEAEGSFAVLHGLFWTVLDVAGDAPLLLAVEDLHWADTPSLRFLAYLARRIEELPVLLLATVRTGEPDVDEDLLDAVRQAPATVLTPAPLSAEAVKALLVERLGEAEAPFVAAVQTATGGNPLLVRELAGALEDEGVAPVAARAEAVRAVGPRAVRRTVAPRLGRLSDDAVATARAVAILGDGVTVAEAARFAGLDDDRVASATGPLARAEILRAEPPLAFVHPLVADAVLQELSPGERELQHARAARLLHESGAPVEQVAGHLLRAPGAGERWVVDVLTQAAQTALRQGAAEIGATFLRRALDEPPPGEERANLLLFLGLAEALSNGAEATEHLRGALAALVIPEQRALAAAVLGRTLLFTGDPLGGAGVAREVAAELADEHSDLRDQLTAFAYMTSWFDERAATARDDTAHLRDRVPGSGSGAGERMLAAVTSYGWASVPGSREDCVALALAALDGDALTHADNGLLNVPPAVVLAFAEHPGGLVHLEAGLAAAHRGGSLFAAAGMHVWLALVHMLRSELEEAIATGRQAVDELAMWGFDTGPDLASAFLVSALVARGELAEARAVSDSSRAPEIVTEGTRHWYQAELALLAAERRDDDALEVAERLARDFDHIRNPATATWRVTRAELRHRAGDAAGALDNLSDQLTLARQWGAPGPIGQVLRVRGELFDEPADLREALTFTRETSARIEHAKVLLALGRRLRLDRKPTEAREPLREALDVAASCGALGLVAEVRAELAASGVRPRTEALSGPESLTPSEKRIATLASSGLTNRDIAQQLFVTPKTVEVHLSAVYRKLGIGSRRALGSALAA